MTHCDVVIIGGGAAGLMAASTAGQRGRRVVVIDRAQKLGAKILISGGGRCNFTNQEAGPGNYVSENPHFSKSALSRYTQADFIALVRKYGIPFHEKKLGQLFCDGSAQAILDLLLAECAKGNVGYSLNTQVKGVEKRDDGFRVESARGTWECASLVIATGGLSLPKTGATEFGYQIARQFGLRIVPPSPALDGFVLAPELLRQTQDLSGVSLDCIVTTGDISFRENILFTHKGLSGPAALQASLHWQAGMSIQINLFPEESAEAWLLKKEGSGAELKNLLKEKFPDRFAEFFASQFSPVGKRLAQMSNRELKVFAGHLQGWTLVPVGTVGYGKAEVTRGGVDTNELSSKTMEARKVPGLYFIGEVVDVTGWLGGYNFQWAWSSGHAAGEVV